MRSLILDPPDGASSDSSFCAPGFHLLGSLPGAESLTGSYAVPTGAIRSSYAGLLASDGACEAADATGG